MLKQVKIVLLCLFLCGLIPTIGNAYPVQASQVQVQDAGNYFSIKNVEAALQQIGAEIAAGVNSFAKSIVNTSGTVTLVNDQLTPGNNYAYSTNNSGVKGWYPESATVTTGNLTSGTGLSIANGTGAVVGTGSSVNITSGYYLPLTSDQTNWNLAYSNMLTSSSSPTFAALTLTGLSGVLKATGGAITGSATLSDLGSPLSAFSMNSQNLINVLNPVNPQDAATKAYVDAEASGLQPKAIAQEATTTALPANTYSNGSSGVGATLTANSNGALTIDGTAVSLNDRVIVQNEAAPANNGIYTVTTLGASGAEYVLTRATDNNTSALIKQSYVYTLHGTVNGGSSFVNTNTGTVTIGTTAITWIQFSVPLTLNFTLPLSLSGSTVSISQSNTSTNGYLSSTDWNTFNGKQSSLGNISGIVKGNGSGSYSAAVADTDYTTPTGTETLSNKTLNNTNTATLLDNRLTLQNSSDNTKQVTVSLSGITTGNTRVLTVPDASTTLVGTDNTQTLTNKTYDTASAGNILKINGTQVSSVTGTGSVVLNSSPSLTAPSFASIINSGTLTLPISTDTLVGRATSDILTNKTYDTAGSGNMFKINGTQISSVSGSTSKVATVSGSSTANHCTEFDASGNIIDSGAGCTGSSVINSGTAGQPSYYATTGTTLSGFPLAVYSSIVNSSSGVDNPLNLAFTTTESGTAGYTGIKENVTETSTGSGNKYLLDLLTGGTDEFHVDHSGNAFSNGSLMVNGGSNSVINGVSGNVGIGTTVPGSLLGVGSSTNGGSITHNAFNVDSSGNITNLGGVVSNINAGGWFQYGSGSAITFGNIAYGIGDAVELAVGSSTGSIKFAPSSNVITDVFNTAGNLGIGTTQPSYPIDEGSGTIQSGNVHLPNPTLNFAAQSGMNFDPSYTGFLVTMTPGRLVGINNLNPAAQLDVTGTVKMTAFSMPTGAANGYVLTSNSSGTGTWQASTGGSSQWSGTTGSNIYYNQMGANVGIGTSNPGQILDVSGTIRGTNIIDSGVTASTVMVVDANKQLHSATNLIDTAYSTAIGANPTGTIGLAAVNGSSANFIRADGAPALSQAITPTWTGEHIFNGSPTAISTGVGDNVGIGTTLPYGPLDVEGTTSPVVFFGNGKTPQQNVGIGSSSPGVQLDVQGSARFLGSGNSSIGGNLGIGSLNPGSLLDVDGTIRIVPEASVTGVRYLCINTTGQVISQATACVGT